MKSKLSLNDLKVRSFVTGLESKVADTARGGVTCNCPGPNFSVICAQQSLAGMCDSNAMGCPLD